MSTIIMSACWPLQMPATAKIVLISLADNANDHGDCWPSIPKICERTCYSRRAVIDAIAWLEGSGILKSDKSFGRSNNYHIAVDGFDPNYSAPSPRSLRRSEKSDEPAQEPVRQMHQCGSRTSAANAQEPVRQMHKPVRQMHKPVRQMHPNRKEPTRTVKSNRQDAQAPVDLLPDIPAALVRDFLAVRKAKKSPLTETAVAGLQREAEKAGMTLEAVIRTCCERGWVGFKADWLAREQAERGNVVPLRQSQNSGAQPARLPELRA